MQKRNLKVLFCVILFISLISPSVISDLAPPLDMMTTPFSPTPVTASEDENVDSFNVHPANRWTEANDGYTATVENSILNCTDQGDSSGDSYTLDRSLSKSDSKVYIRFRFTTNGTVGDTSNNVAMYLYGTTLGTSHVSLIVRNITTDSYVGESLIRFVNTEGTVIIKTLTGDERLHTDTWYIFCLKYNTLESELEYELSFGNKSKIWAYDYYDLDSTIPQIFAEEALTLRIYTALETTNYYQQTWWDYVNAPFKEREWKQVNTPTDTDYKSDSWAGAYCYDDIDDQSTWRLNIPYLDSASGKMVIDCNEESVLTTGNFDFYVRLYAVDGDDGDLHEVFEIRLYLWAAWNIYGSVYADSLLVDTFFLMSLTTDEPESTIDWSIVLSDDRSEAFLQTRMNFNDGDGEYSIPANCTISNAATDPSTEFVLEVDYLPDFDEDVEFTASLEGFTLAQRDIFADILQPVVEGILGLIGEIFILIGRFIASIFKIIGDLIVVAVDALQPLLTAISAAIVAMQTALDSAIGLVQTAVDGLVAWIQAIAGDILALIGDFIDDGIAWCLTIIADIIDLLAAIMFAIYDGLFETVFGFAEAPDLLALVYNLGTGFIQLIIGLIAFIPTFATYIDDFFRLATAIGLVGFFIFPVLQGDGLGGFFSNMLHNMNFDITFGLTIFGVGGKLPAVFPWIIISIATVFSDAIYAGFF